MGEMKPHIPSIPPDAKRAAHHAPPSDLDNPAPAPQPAQAATGGEGEMQEVPVTPPAQESSSPEPPYYASPEIPYQPQAYESPEPIEAMFAQLRDDQKRMERMLLFTNLTALAVIALALYAMKRGGMVDAV